MKFNPEKLEKLAEGTEKIIYHHPNDPEKVVAEFRSDVVNAREIKGRYYLTKILHSLFPRTIPDISMAGKEEGGNPIIVLEKKHLDPEHNELRDLTSLQQMKSHRGESDQAVDNEVLNKELASLDDLENNPTVKALSNLLRQAGLEMVFDVSPRNFGYDAKGNLAYVDNSFFPWWEEGNGSIEPKNYNGLREAIQKMDDKESSARAMSYLERLEDLRTEAEAEAIKNNSKVSAIE